MFLVEMIMAQYELFSVLDVQKVRLRTEEKPVLHRSKQRLKEIKGRSYDLPFYINPQK